MSTRASDDRPRGVRNHLRPNMPWSSSWEYASIGRMPLDSKQAAQIKVFGANLRRERMLKKITQEKLAEQVDLNIRTIQKIEAGHVNILFTTVMRLRKALGCSWDALMEK